MPTVADYEDAVRRIVEADVPPDATTKDEVARALADADAPQVTREVADGIADAIVTEDRVIDAIEATGELPSEGEIDAIVSVADDYDMSDRIESVSREVENTVATIEDVERAVRERQDQKGTRPTFREDVEGAVDSVASQKQFVGETPDEVTGEQAREIGAPRKADFQRAAAQSVATADQVSPADVIEGTEAKTPVYTIKDTSGNPIAATGGPSDEMGERVAEEIGADYMSREAIVDSMTTAGTGSRVSVTLQGRKVGEVDVS